MAQVKIELPPIPPAPSTPVEPVGQDFHGVKYMDHFRWLEGDEQGKTTDRVSTWTDAQNARTRAVFDNLPGRAAIKERLASMLTLPSVSAPASRGNRYFFTKREGTQAQSVLLVQDGIDGKPRVLFDPNGLDKKGLVTLSLSDPSQDGKLIAIGTYRAGDENTTVGVYDIDRGVWLADQVGGKVGGVDWMPDNSGFLYRNLWDVKNPYSGQVCYHALGTASSQDKVLFKQYTEGPLASTWGPSFSMSRDARWLILTYSTSTKANDMWVVDFDKYRRTGVLEKVTIAEGIDARFGGPIDGDTMFLYTTDGSPNGQVFAVDLTRPARANWKPLIPERNDANLTGVQLARGILITTYAREAVSEIVLHTLDGQKISDLKLPGLGSAGLSTNEDRTEAFLSYGSYNTAREIFRLDLAKPDDRTLWDSVKLPIDTDAIAVTKVTYKSKDGTPVGMFLIHKKGMELSGNHPVLLYGYGGFAIGTSPGFDPSRAIFVEEGGIVALPMLRGGNEYGEKWHTAGMLANKQNVFDDFIGAAEYLIAQNYTSSKHIVIQGGSNGGLLTGATLVQRPDLFAGAISAVPLLDMLRYENFLMAKYWVPEYGTAQDSAQFEFIRKYSPYQNIKDGVQYPAVFLTAGENDSRVHPLHARKMAARLQEVSAAAPGGDGKPVFLWVDRDAGHGAGKPLEARLQTGVDQLMFVMWQLGMLK